MSVRIKTLLVVVATVVLSTAGIHLASRMTFLNGFAEIEAMDLEANVRRTSVNLEQLSHGIVLSARAYAVWDDMYYFVSEPDPAFLENLGLTPEIFATHQANLIAILDRKQQPLFLEMVDLRTQQPLPVPAGLAEIFRPGSSLLEHSPGRTEIAGWILLDGRPMYIASLAGLRTDFSGEPRGAVVFGRYLDAGMIQRMLSEERLTAEVFELNDPRNPPDVQSAALALNSQPLFTEQSGQDRISGYSLVRTLDGQPAFLLKVTLPRTIYTQGLNSFLYFATFAIVSGILFILVTTALLHSLVLTPLARLSRKIKTIRTGSDLSQRLEVRGGDEIARLSQTINGMLDSIQQHTQTLETANEGLESFAHSVSHDMRAPLRAVNSYVQILLDDHSDQLDEQAMRYLQRVRESTTRLGKMVDALLRFSRLDRQPLRKEEVLPREIAQQALDDFQTDIAERKIAVQVHDLPACMADPDLLRQVYANLIGNAVKYTATNPAAEIEIGWTEQDGQTVYTVQDNGAGFDMEQAERMFKPFQRLLGSENYSGEGVGLAIVDRIVRRHGGRVWAEGEAGRGAVFSFTL